MMMLQKKNLSGWLRTLLSTTNAKKHNRGTKARTGRKMLLESLERREVFDAGWATVMQSNIFDIVGDRNDNHYLTGSFSGTATFGDTTLPGNGSSDLYVAKQDANGKFLWAVRAGNPLTQDNSSKDIALDPSGNIYISGRNRGCAQPQLTAAWVNQVSAMGWGLITTIVGYQAPCSVCASCQKHSFDAGVAETQGRAEADIAITDANNLGLTQGGRLGPRP